MPENTIDSIFRLKDLLSEEGFTGSNQVWELLEKLEQDVLDEGKHRPISQLLDKIDSKSERFNFDSAFSKSPLPTLLFSEELIVLDANEAFENLSNKPKHEFISTSLNKIVSDIEAIQPCLKSLNINDDEPISIRLKNNTYLQKCLVWQISHTEEKNAEYILQIFETYDTEQTDVDDTPHANQYLKKKLVSLLSSDIYIHDTKLQEIIDVDLLEGSQDKLYEAFKLSSAVVTKEKGLVCRPHSLPSNCLKKIFEKQADTCIDDSKLKDLVNKEQHFIKMSCKTGLQCGQVPIKINDEILALWILVDENGRYSKQEFQLLLGMLTSFINELSNLGYNNLKLGKEIVERQQIEVALLNNELIFRELAENINDALILSNKEDILYINPAFERIFGIKKEIIQIAPFRLNEFVHPEDKEEYVNARNNSESFNLQYRIKNAKNETKWLWTRAFPVKDQSGDTYRRVSITTDITEKIKTEEALRQSEQNLKNLNATKDKMFSIIAHDLKNPFGLILGFSKLLVEKIHRYDKEKTYSFVKNIYNSSVIVYNLLENLLEWSRSQTGSLRFRPEKFQLEQLVLLTMSETQLLADFKKIKQLYSIPENTWVYADKQMINTVLRNLLTNAIKFTPEKGNVSVWGEINENFFIVEVKDTGIGIAEEKLTNIFSDISNKSTAGTKNEKGTGLGLILCKEFVERNKGEITVESTPNIGTTFRFTLPLAH